MEVGQRAIAYVRVSVVGGRAKRGRFESPELQRQAIDAWCEQRDIRVVDEVRDLNRLGRCTPLRERVFAWQVGVVRN